MEVSLPKILTNLEQTVMFLCQAFDNILYTRRFNALKQIAGDLLAMCRGELSAIIARLMSKCL